MRGRVQGAGQAVCRLPLDECLGQGVKELYASLAA